MLAYIVCLILASAVELFAFEARAQSDGVWKACELGRKEPDQSIRACSEVLTRGGATTLRPAALHNRGIAYTAKGDLDRALVDLSEAIRLDPQRAFRFQERGELHLRRREFDRAIADLTRAIQMDPIRAFRFHFRAHAYREAGDLDRAILDFTEAIRLDSTHSFRFYDRASAFRDKGEWVKAIADYDVAIRLDPKSAGSYAERGWLHLRLGRVEQAVVDLSEAVRLDPNYAEAHARLGEASRTSGDLHAAERAAQQQAELKREREQDAARPTRLAALDRLKAVQKEAEDRTPKDAPSSFRRRLEALRAEFASVEAAGSVGPSFDCAKAITPLSQIICGNPDLRRVDLEFVRPFYALHHLIPDRQDELREEADDLTRRVLASCRIPETGRASPELSRRAAPCIAAAYRRQKEIWARRVEGSGPSSAREEISRSLEAHIRLQEQLRVVGHLSQEAPADGVYGGMTRQGIAALQRAEQLPSDGFLSNAAAARLPQTTGAVRTETPTANRSGPDPAVIQRIAALEQRYSGYLAELGAVERERVAQAAAAERERAAQAERAERERAAKTAALAKLRGWRETLQPLLRKPIPENVRTPLVALVTEIEVAERSGASGDIPRIEAKFVQAQPTIEAAQTLARVLTDKNRFLVEGDRDDIVFIYNASPKAPSVTKDLSGKFVFDPDRTAACFLHNPVTDRLTLRLLRDKAAALGAPLKFPLARCAPDQLQKQDVLVFQRDPFVGQPINFVATVASAVDAGVFVSMAILPGSELKTAAQAEAEAVKRAETLVEQGMSGGFGFLIPGTSSRTVCHVVASGTEGLHDRLLQPHRDKLAEEFEELKGTPSSSTKSPDEAFLSTKRGQCGIIYASAPDLKRISDALNRDGHAFRYLSIWISQEAVEADERATLADRLARARAEAEEMLNSHFPFFPSDVRAFLTAFVARAAAVNEGSELAALRELEGEFASMKGRLEQARKLASAVTPRSQSIVAGDRGDVMVFYNDSPTAPSAARNLRGEIVFAEGRASACTFHTPLTDVFVNRQVREKIRALGGDIPRKIGRCEPSKFDRTDLVIAERDRLLREPVDSVVNLMKAVNQGVFAPFTTLSESDLADAKRAEAVQAGEIEAAVRARRDETGFGVIVLSNPSNVVCTVTASEQDAHSATLERLADRLRDELPGEPSASSTSAEGAFLSARRGQCGAVYGSGGTLATLVEALEPDGVVFRFAPVWVRGEEIAAMSATIRERERKRVEQEDALRREREDRKRLDELRDKDREKLRSEQEATLRAQYGAMARAFELSLAKELKDYILVQPSAFARKYQSLARRYEHLKADAWEFMTVETSLFDYGTSEFKGRSLETAFANSRIRLRNRVVGEYKDLCFTTGFISDTEFGVEREPFGVLCEDDAVALERHKQGQKFTSRWLVQ